MRGLSKLGRSAVALGVLAASAFWPLAAHATDPGKKLAHHELTVFRRADGLPHNAARELAQTPDGYFWLATRNGLARYDGARFVVVGPSGPQPPPGPNALALEVDDAGRLWVGTDDGVWLVDGGTVRVYGEASGLSGKYVSRLLATRNGGLLAWGEGGLYRYEADRFVRVLGREEGFPPSQVTDMVEAEDGSVWMAFSGAGLGRFSGGHLAMERVGADLPGNTVTGMAMDRAGDLWLTTSAGLFVRRARGGVEAIPSPPGMPRVNLRRILVDRHGAIWFGSAEGLVRIAGGRWELLGEADGLRSKFVDSVHEDLEGNIWFGTQNGINRLVDVPFQTWTQRDGLPFDRVTAVCADADGDIWASGFGGGVARSVDGGFERQGVGLLPSGNVGAVACAPDGGVWLGVQFHGAMLLRDGRIAAHATWPGHEEDQVTALSLQDDTLWIGTLKSGVKSWRAGEVRGWRAKDGLPSDQVNTLHAGYGAVWVGTSRGLALLRGETLRSWGAGDGIGKDPFVRALLPSGDAIWAASLVGLARVGLDGTVADAREMPPSLGLHRPSTLFPDRDGGLWATSEVGILHTSRAAFQAFAEGRAPKLPGTLFGAADGISAEMVSGQSPAAQGGDGRLWFASTGGLVSGDPARLSRDLPEPMPILEEVLLDGAPVAVAAGLLEVGPGGGRLDLRWAAPTTTAPARLKFRYRLDGFDAGWTEAGDARTATYTNLPPGRYRFFVEAGYGDERSWGAGRPLLSVRKAPLLHETWWFWAVSAAVLAGCVAFGLRLAYARRIAAINERHALVLAERTRVARELHDTLLQGFAGVALQMRAASKRISSSPEQAREVLESAVEQATQSLAEARHAVWDMRSPLLERGGLAAALDRFAAEVSARSGIPVRSDASGASRLPANVEAGLLRIAQEAVSNAVKHAGPTQVKVCLTARDGTATLEIRDDGVGFNADPDLAARCGHWGLVGMAERAKSLGGKLDVDSRPGHGALVRVEVPL